MIESIVGFFKKGQHGDMLFFKSGGFWSSAWTVAPHDPDNVPRIAEQFVAMKADGLRYAEKVVLQSADGSLDEVVVVTDLPLGRQTVVAVDSGHEKMMRNPVRTETLTAITAAIKAVSGS